MAPQHPWVLQRAWQELEVFGPAWSIMGTLPHHHPDYNLTLDVLDCGMLRRSCISGKLSCP